MVGKTRQLAVEYANAIFNEARNQGLVKEIAKDLLFVVDLFKENDELKTFLEDPCVDVLARQRAIEVILDGKVEKLTFDFVSILIEKRLEFLLPFVFEEFTSLLNNFEGILEVEITTAYLFSDEEYSVVESELEKLLSRPIKLKKYTDEDLIGGMVLKIGDKRIDGSISTKLKKMKNLLRRNNTDTK